MIVMKMLIVMMLEITALVIAIMLGMDGIVRYNMVRVFHFIKLFIFCRFGSCNFFFRFRESLGCLTTGPIKRFTLQWILTYSFEIHGDRCSIAATRFLFQMLIVVYGIFLFFALHDFVLQIMQLFFTQVVQ